MGWEFMGTKDVKSEVLMCLKQPQLPLCPLSSPILTSITPAQMVSSPRSPCLSLYLPLAHLANFHFLWENFLTPKLYASSVALSCLWGALHEQGMTLCAHESCSYCCPGHKILTTDSQGPFAESSGSRDFCCLGEPRRVVLLPPPNRDSSGRWHQAHFLCIPVMM